MCFSGDKENCKEYKCKNGGWQCTEKRPAIPTIPTIPPVPTPGGGTCGSCPSGCIKIDG